MAENQKSKNNDVDISKPFRPASGSKFVADTPGQLISRGQNSESGIDIEKDDLQSEEEIDTENHKRQEMKISRPFDLLLHPKLNKSCQQSLESIVSLNYVRRLWFVGIKEIESLKKTEYALLSRHGDIKDQTKSDLSNATEILKQPSYTSYFDSMDLDRGTCPKFLWGLYLGKGMDRRIISRHLETAPGSLTGASASSWEFRHLVDLSAIPLFNLELDAILPQNHNAIRKEVMGKIDECFIAQRILKDITIPTAKNLYQFEKGTHMSWYLLNPWFLFFTGLRDLLTRGNSEIKHAWNDKSEAYGSSHGEEDKLENMSEQLLHRFMEVVLVLFSIISDSRDEYRSTPSRVNSTVNVGNVSCNILDDGYVYMSRSGTSKDSDRSRYGHIPIIRYEAKRLKHARSAGSDVTAQIFSELLSAAVENMKYLKYTDPSATEPRLPEEPLIEAKYDYIRNIDLAPYHDAFVISMSHYTLRIHTARFPTPYLRWVTEADKGDVCEERYCILHKVSTSYDLSLPEKRLEAAQDILILLWAIRNGGFEDSPSGIFIARALMKQTILKVVSKTNATTSKINVIDEEEPEQDSNEYGKEGESAVVNGILSSCQANESEPERESQSALIFMLRQAEEDKIKKKEEVSQYNIQQELAVRQNQHELQVEAQAVTISQYNTHHAPGIIPKNTGNSPPSGERYRRPTKDRHYEERGDGRSQYGDDSRGDRDRRRRDARKENQRDQSREKSRADRDRRRRDDGQGNQRDRNRKKSPTDRDRRHRDGGRDRR